jgi:hypothetical protein
MAIALAATFKVQYFSGPLRKIYFSSLWPFHYILVLFVVRVSPASELTGFVSFSKKMAVVGRSRTEEIR